MSFDTVEKIRHSEAFSDIAAWLDSEQSAMLERVIAWSEINSGSGNPDGLKQMIREVAHFAADLQANITEIQLDDGERLTRGGELERVKNGSILCMQKHVGAPVQILLTGHLDTVFPTNSHFQKTAWLDDETLNGPGVADMKGGIIVMLMALKALEKSSMAGKVGWKVMLSPDEETGSLASAPHLVEAAKNFDLGLTYEPALADGTLAGARKGSGNYSIHVKGVAAHAGRAFDEGRNAVVALSDIFVSLASLSHKREGLTVNAGVIAGGTATNVVPDSAYGQFNIRLNKAEDALWFEDELRKIAAKWQGREGYDVAVHGGINRPPKVISDKNQRLMDFIKACGAALDIKVAYVPTGGCCEGNNLADAGLANVDTLGVRGGDIHSDKEFLIVESLAERAKLSALILMVIADGGLEHFTTKTAG